MTDPRPNNEPRPRVTPEDSRPRIPSLVLGILALAVGVIWLVLLVVHLVNGDPVGVDTTWLPLIAGVLFVFLGVSRILLLRRR